MKHPEPDKIRSLVNDMRSTQLESVSSDIYLQGFKPQDLLLPFITIQSSLDSSDELEERVAKQIVINVLNLNLDINIGDISVENIVKFLQKLITYNVMEK